MGYLRLGRPNKYQVSGVMCHVLVAAILFSPAVGAGELPCAKVTADRVNVRVRPDINSEIVTQLSLNEDVKVLEKGDEWTRIKAPVHSNCWVHSECVSGAKIKTDSVNLRCGPGLAFPVLVRLKKGTPINIIEVFGEWIRIEPPVEFGVWVNSKYLECEKPIPLTLSFAKASEGKPPSPPEERSIEEKPPPQPQIVSAPEEEFTGVELVSYAGRLEDLGIIINRPGTYKLVLEKDKWLCIIKSPTLDVNPYVNRVIRIEGVVISKSSTWGVPVIELKRLSVIK